MTGCSRVRGETGTARACGGRSSRMVVGQGGRVNRLLRRRLSRLIRRPRPARTGPANSSPFRLTRPITPTTKARCRLPRSAGSVPASSNLSRTRPSRASTRPLPCAVAPTRHPSTTKTRMRTAKGTTVSRRPDGTTKTQSGALGADSGVAGSAQARLRRSLCASRRAPRGLGGRPRGFGPRWPTL